MKMQVQLWVRLKVIDLVTQTARITLTEKLNFADALRGITHYWYWGMEAEGADAKGVLAEIDRVMQGFDALLAPSRPVPSTKVDEEFPSAIRGAGKDLMGAIGNLAGLPAISVPDGFTEHGVPTGLQFMGRPYDENIILAAAGAYQKLTDWHLRHPPGTLS